MKKTFEKTLIPSKNPSTLTIDGEVYVLFSLAKKKTNKNIKYNNMTYYKQ